MAACVAYTPHTLASHPERVCVCIYIVYVCMCESVCLYVYCVYVCERERVCVYMYIVGV